MWSHALRDDAGFSLIETLVALAILASIGAAATQVLAISDKRSALILDRFRALVVAESLIERAGLDVPLNQEHRRGRTSDGTRWTLQAVPYSERDGDRVYAPIGLVRLEATAGPVDGMTPPVRLQTLRALDQPFLRR